jgi:signal peptidase II
MSTLCIAAAASFILSFTGKLIADAFLVTRVAIIGSLVGLEPTGNPGVAFGVRFPPQVQLLIIVGALIAVIMLARTSRPSRLNHIGFGLIIGGAFANLADRSLDGLVTDFFQVGTFPVFNVADSCITIGVALLLLEILFAGESRKGS